MSIESLHENVTDSDSKSEFVPSCTLLGMPPICQDFDQSSEKSGIQLQVSSSNTLECSNIYHVHLLQLPSNPELRFGYKWFLNEADESQRFLTAQLTEHKELEEEQRKKGQNED
ncbi:hypothetical protein CEXT_251061 [Caerostris extrusa]|uniref:Uncharacterized protein n=1 Tax=Caerostris extrusa TaxID=172846 RepID=A0AAV4M441_CAEEX|nr:hypothetical protein CEXT_251061 [Caerostris extrusa]